MNENNINDWEKEFDEKFELENQGCSECHGFYLIDKTEIRYPKDEYDLDGIKAFIRQTRLDLLNEILEKVQEDIDFGAKHQQIVSTKAQAYLLTSIAGLQVGVDIIRSKMK